MNTRRGPQAVLLLLWLTVLHVPQGAGQGRLQLPLGRSSLWRTGLDTPRNYEDHMLECGGLWYKAKRNNQCGMCGDPVDMPRDNEEGGKFTNGIIAGSYSPGQRTQFKVLMNSNHGGYMEFKMCPESWVSQECLDKHPIPMADGSGNRFYLPEEKQGVFNVDVIIPSMTCERCVMQWTYTGDQEWGRDETGAECKGCGPQYELRNCADISVTNNPSSAIVLPAIFDYNQAENGGLNPKGTYWFDRSSVDTPPRSGSPFAPPPKGSNNNVDPWTSPRTPSMNQSPPRMSNRNPDPWNNPGTPTMNQSPPRMNNRNPDPWTNPRTPTMNRSPPRMNNRNPDPWNNRPTSTTNQSPRMNNRNPDPWNNQRTPTMNQSPPRSDPIPYAPPQKPQGNTNRDPWPNQRTPMIQSPPRKPTMNQSPPRRPSNPDPWTNPRTPTMNQSPPRRPSNPNPWTNPRTPTMNQSPPRSNPIPYAPPPRRNNINNNDPWNNPPTPAMSQSPPRRPRMNQSPPRSNPIPYAPPPRRNSDNNNNADPWNNPPTPAMRQAPLRTNNNNPDPWRNPSQGNPDPWRNPSQRTPDPWGNPSQGNPDPWGNPSQRTPDPWGNPSQRNPDPWGNPSQRNPDPRGNPSRRNGGRSPFVPPAQNSMRFNLPRTQRGSDPLGPAVNPATTSDPAWGSNPTLLQGNNPSADLGRGGSSGGPQVPTVIESIRVFTNQTVIVPPRVTCVAIGTKAEMEGMSKWCTENCNMSYCPEDLCSCW